MKGSKKMISWSDSKRLAAETPDEAGLNISYRQSVRPLYNAHYADDKDRHSRTSMLCPEDEELIKDCLISDDRLMLKEPCSSFYDQDYYVEKIKELHLYVDMVKKIVKPGCSSEVLNVALSSMSSLVKTLSEISSEQYMRSSL